MKKTFLLLLGFLLVPIVLTLLELKTGPVIYPLGGSFEKVTAPSWSWNHFFSGKFQSQFSDFIDAQFGVRALFIRLRNQVHYSVWHQLHAQKVVEGRDHFIYEKDHISAYQGKDVLSEKTVEATAKDRNWIQTRLAEKGIVLVTVLAPSKASFYPDKMGEVFEKEMSVTNNYLLLRDAFIKEDVSFFDSLERLRERASTPIKEKSERQNWIEEQNKNWSGKLAKSEVTQPNDKLYPKYGTHWSINAAYYIGSDLVEYLKTKHQLKLQSLSIEEGDHTLLPKYTDADIFQSLNLLYTLPWGHYDYPKVVYRDEVKGPSLLAIGDSFYQSLMSTGIIEHVFGDSEFWYYAKVSYLPNGSYRSVENLSYRETLLSKKVIVLLVSEVNFKWFGFGFIEKAREALE